MLNGLIVKLLMANGNSVSYTLTSIYISLIFFLITKLE